MQSRLNIQRNIPIDYSREYRNPDGAASYQSCTYGRMTELEAIQRIAFGDPIGETYSTLYMNGQIVDTAHMLMCTRCTQWKPDSAFDKNSRLHNTRRGRHYYCKGCRSKSAIFDAPIIDEVTQARLIKGSKRRKKR